MYACQQNVFPSLKSQFLYSLTKSEESILLMLFYVWTVRMHLHIRESYMNKRVDTKWRIDWLISD